MSLRCNIDMCKRKCSLSCYCCNKNLCFNHLKEHRDSMQSQLDPLVNEIKVMNDQLIALNMETSVYDSIERSNEWNDDYSQSIHALFEEDHYNYDQYFVRRIEQLRNAITQLRSTVSELIDERDTTNEDIVLLTLTIRCLKEEIETLQQAATFDNSSPFVTKRITPVQQSPTNDFDISTLSSPFQIIICQNSLGSALASNDHQLLMDQRLSLHLFDQALTYKKQYQWKKDFILDMCWSSSLKRFIFVTNNKQLYLVNDNITSIERIEDIPEQDWSSCTCSDTSLFVTTNHRGASIFQFSLSSRFELLQQWEAPQSCEEHQLIHDIAYNNQNIALIIEDSFSSMIHLELRSSKTLDVIWSFRSDIQYHLFQPAIRCCSLKDDQWLVIDSNHSRLLHINSKGQMKGSLLYKSSPWNAILYDSNTLIIRTENSLNLHRIY